MAKNTIRQRALAGEIVLGSMVFEFFTPGMPQILSLAGAEYAIYDMEHAGLGFETLKMLVAASRGTGVVPMARVPRGEYHFIARALDVGAQGIMVPMVESAEQARDIAQSARYPRQGRRGAAFGFAHDNYEPGSVTVACRAPPVTVFHRTVRASFSGAQGALSPCRRDTTPRLET